MPNTIQVFVDNLTNGDICYAGQTIIGRVECNFSTEKKLNGIRVKFEGKCNTHWNQTGKQYDGKEHRNKNISYRAEEIYFIHEYYLAGGANEFRLPPGKHSYPFSYILPQLLPSSFENDLGKVRYTIKAVADYPWRFNDVAVATLKLFSPLDLNNFPHLRQGIEISENKTMFTWSFSGNSDPLTFKIALPITAYATGQQVKINAHITNLTTVNVEMVNFKIVQVITFMAEHPTTSKKYEERTVTSCSEKGVGAHSEKQWTSVLTVPTDDSVVNMVHCRLINVTYRLHGEAVVPFPHTNLHVEVPLMLGNIPLANLDTGHPLIPTNVDYPYPTPPVLPSPNAPHPSYGFTTNASAPPHEGNYTSPPPSYEEAQQQAGKSSTNLAPQQTKLDVEDSFEWIS